MIPHHLGIPTLVPSVRRHRAKVALVPVSFLLPLLSEFGLEVFTISLLSDQLLH